MSVQVVSWNVADLYFEKYKGYTEAKRDFISQHTSDSCNCVCLQEAWVSTWWPDFETDAAVGLRLGTGLASLGGRQWAFRHFSDATGEDALARKGFSWCDMGEVVVYNAHLQADPALSWCCRPARRVRESQMRELRQHARSKHGTRPVLIVGDFNHQVVPEPGELFTGASNGWDGAITMNSPQAAVVHEYATHLSDHPLIHVRLGPAELSL